MYNKQPSRHYIKKVGGCLPIFFPPSALSLYTLPPARVVRALLWINNSQHAIFPHLCRSIYRSMPQSHISPLLAFVAALPRFFLNWISGSVCLWVRETKVCACEKKGNRVTRAASFSCCSLSLSLSLLKALNHDNSPPPSWWLVVADWEGEGWNASISALFPLLFRLPFFSRLPSHQGYVRTFPTKQRCKIGQSMMFAIHFNIVFFYLHALILRAKSCHDTENSTLDLVLY